MRPSNSDSSVDKTAGSTYFDLGRSADERPGSESRYAQRFQRVESSQTANLDASDLNWFPTYLKEHRHYTLTQMGFYAMLPLLAGTTGDFIGG
jgi:hypothetical protein